MIIKNSKTVSSVMKGNKTIDKIMKGTLVVYEGWQTLIASGVPPLTLNKCKGEDLLDYKIYGNSIQNGTPTPTTPIEIESVGDKTSNLYGDLEKIWIWSSGAVGTEGESEGVKLSASSGDTFSFYAEWEEVNSNNRLAVACYDSNMNFIASSRKLIYNSAKILLKTTCPNNTAYIVCANYITKPSKVMLIKGDYTEDTIPYEPYGYKIPVKVSNDTEEITTNIYLGNPLRKVGDYADYIDFKKGKVFRNVEVIDNTGTQTIKKSFNGVKDTAGTDTELPNIPTLKGTCILSIEDTLNSSYMEVVYKGKGKLEILDTEINDILNFILATDTDTEIDITNTEINNILDEIIGG